MGVRILFVCLMLRHLLPIRGTAVREWDRVEIFEFGPLAGAGRMRIREGTG